MPVFFSVARLWRVGVLLLAALLLAACQESGLPKDQKPVPAKLVAKMEQLDMAVRAPIYIRAFKETSEFEVWKQRRDGQYALLETYEICKWSGKLGPKIKEGDRQAPEGFYTITPAQMNPKSSYYLSFNIGFPNAFDRAHGRTGSHLMVHGACSSAGCYSMTDEAAGEIYALARDAFLGGQRSFEVNLYPFRMTPENMARHRNDPNFDFWVMLKEGNDHFEVTRKAPVVQVCGKRYVFNIDAGGMPMQASLPCPPYRVPEWLDAAVKQKQAQDNAAFQLALSSALSVAFQPNLGGAGGQSIKWRPDPNAGVPYVIGRTAVAGSPVYKNVYGGEKARHLRVINVLSLGPIEGIEATFFNDVATTFNVNRSAVGYYNDVMWFDAKVGDATETAHTLSTPPFTPDPDAVWTSDHKLSGLATDQTVMRYAALKYSTGPATPLKVTLGPAVYDPREDSSLAGGSGSQDSADPETWSFTGRDNPFLQAATFAIGLKGWSHVTSSWVTVMGVGMPLAGIETGAFMEGANVCETNGWTVGGVAYSTDAKLTVLEQMLRAGGGRPIPTGGKLSALVQAPRVSLATLTGEDLVGPASLSGPPGMSQRFNTVIPRYREEDRGWEIIAADPVSVSAFVTEDGETRTKEIGYPYVQDKDQAAQLARYDIWESREAGPWELPVRPRWRTLKPGDCIEFQEPELGIPDPVKLLVRERTRNPVTGRVVLRCWTETDAKHADALGATGTLPTAGGADTTEPGIEPPDSGTWTATPGVATGGGAEIPVIYIAGASDSVEAADLFVRYRIDGASDWEIAAWPVDAPKMAIPALAPIADYEIEYAYRSVRGAVSETWTPDAGGLVTTGDLVPMDDSVTTPKIVDEAVTEGLDLQIQIDAWGGGGGISIAWQGSGTDTYTQLDEYAFTYGGEGTVLVTWTGLIQWTVNSGRWARLYLCVDGAPVLAVFESGYEMTQRYDGSANNSSDTAVLSANLSGLSAGAHTIEIYGKSSQSTGMPYLDVGSTTRFEVVKK